VPVGFKIFAIKGGSLFSRICLKNQDIIQSVNDVNLRQLDQGFAIYDAFENAREVRINFLRAGNPMSVTVKISG
jgi:type II secretory pathway component PulC